MVDRPLDMGIVRRLLAELGDAEGTLGGLVGEDAGRRRLRGLALEGGQH